MHTHTSSRLLELLLWFQFCLASHASITTLSAAVTPTIPHPPSYTSPELFKDTILSASNTYRRNHNASELTWNETLTKYARDWAEGCKWRHSDGPYGENLAFGYADPITAVSAWGDEGQKYNFKLPTGFTEETGHFTQLVWRATKEVGCAAVDCGYSDGSDAKDKHGQYTRAQGWYVVCEYSPAGNVIGNNNAFFRVNVQSTSTYSGPTATGAETGAVATSTGTSGVGGMYDNRYLGAETRNVLVGLMLFVNMV
ncbi:putative extracellular SCP domain protein Pry1 [Aspergillus clavatus NRRL 1]|uniref:Secretion pathway protein Sls2/Rcy1, putative n=1 Tax=Aspergillus clavatus (strain ATCC 1007 / CBS 513.65 / DSM 816 / NCTC 3887 / NRRL 1 / QM 1276 / 107) TaxID=344612 RepID=A1CS91_ASPCL|nr:secretion pathway protein Sls2/Rcy1, putative [Aspergillus clavatus NRRL 1]EAW08512.1 secretion pathway protein Sls2/Rcy1, putative [Aspergillus clavatus NRRL 1]